MKHLAKKTWVLGVIGACGLGTWHAGQALWGEATASKHLVNRLWIERRPEDHRDMVGKLVILRSERGRLGVAGRSSVWRHMFEVFKWAKEEDRLMTVFPQSRVRAAFDVRTWKCKGEAPKPFELCLELKRGDRSVTFYSKREWVVRPESATADLKRLVEAEPGLAGSSIPVELDASLPSGAVPTSDLPAAEPSWMPGW